MSRKNFGAKPYLYPQPVIIIGTYDENGRANAMNAAWGGIVGSDQIIIDLGTHKTTENMKKTNAFTVNIADAEHVVECDYVGVESGSKVENKMEKAGFTVTKSEFVNAPIINELPIALECELTEVINGSLYLGRIKNVSIDEKPSAENTAWKQAYIDYINENGRKTDTLSGGYIEFYKLVDINGDEIPELYINYGSTATGDEICSYYNDTVIKQHIYNFGFSYIEGQNLFCDSGGHMDRYYDKVYTIENGTFKLLCDGEYGAENNARVQLDENGRPIYFYKFNGDDVSTKDEHEGLLKSVYDKDEARNPAREAEYNSADHRYEGEGICYYDEIIEAINKY